MDKFETEVNVCAHYVAVRYWNIPESVQEVDDLESLLTEEAENRAQELIAQGYQSGELNCLVHNDEAEAEVRGWWEIISS
jgi:hypothetical protein